VLLKAQGTATPITRMRDEIKIDLEAEEKYLFKINGLQQSPKIFWDTGLKKS